MNFLWIAVPLLAMSTAAVPAPELMITRAGAPLSADSFSASDIDTNRWTAGKGEWHISGGVLSGAELEKDNHAAVVRTGVLFENAVIRFRFRFDGAGGISLSINEEKGHHSRVVIAPDGFSLQKDRDKKDAESLSLPLGRCNMTFAPGVWYTMTVEYSGNDLLAWIDETHFAIGTHDGIHVPKNNIGFTVRGVSAQFDDFFVCAAEPDSRAAARIEQLRQRQTLRADRAADPRTAYVEAETVLRAQLMESDPEFNAMVKKRIAAEAELHKRWPRAFRPGAVGQENRRRLIAEDEEFKNLNSGVTKSRQAETVYLLGKDPSLSALRDALREVPPAK